MRAVDELDVMRTAPVPVLFDLGTVGRSQFAERFGIRMRP